MADNSILAAYLASRQLAGGQKDPLAARERLAASLSAQGSSTEPVRSWGEGLARSLQGGLGGLIAGYTDKERKDTEAGNMSALADYLKTGNADSLKGMKGDLGSMLTAQLASQKMALGQTAEGVKKLGENYGVGAAPPLTGAAGGVAQPGYGASSAPGQVTLAQLESSGNPNAVNPQSGATGLYQFMPGTAADVRAKHPELNLPADFRSWTPEQQGAAQQAFQGDNAKVLSSAGIQPTPANLYLAHRAGAQGAQTILNASPDAPLSTVVPPEWIAQNPDMRTTVGQFVAQANQRFPGQAGGPAPGVPGQIAQGPQVAQGSGPPGDGSGTPVPPAAPAGSTAPGVPNVPRPQANAADVRRILAQVGPGGLTVAEAQKEIEASIDRQWTVDRERANKEFDLKAGDYRAQREQQAEAQRHARGLQDKKDNPQYTQEQNLAHTYATRLNNTIPQLEALARDPSKIPSWAEQMNAISPYYPEPLVSDKAKEFRRVAKDIMSATLRRESGASIHSDEYTTEAQKFIPQPGDSPQIVANKLAALKQAARSIAEGTGRPVESYNFFGAAPAAGAGVDPSQGGGLPPPPPGFRPIQ